MFTYSYKSAVPSRKASSAQENRSYASVRRSSAPDGASTSRYSSRLRRCSTRSSSGVDTRFGTATAGGQAAQAHAQNPAVPQGFDLAGYLKRHGPNAGVRIGVNGVPSRDSYLSGYVQKCRRDASEEEVDQFDLHMLHVRKQHQNSGNDSIMCIDVEEEGEIDLGGAEERKEEEEGESNKRGERDAQHEPHTSAARLDSTAALRCWEDHHRHGGGAGENTSNEKNISRRSDFQSVKVQGAGHGPSVIPCKKDTGESSQGDMGRLFPNFSVLVSWRNRCIMEWTKPHHNGKKTKLCISLPSSSQLEMDSPDEDDCDVTTSLSHATSDVSIVEPDSKKSNPSDRINNEYYFKTKLLPAFLASSDYGQHAEGSNVMEGLLGLWLKIDDNERHKDISNTRLDVFVMKRSPTIIHPSTLSFLQIQPDHVVDGVYLLMLSLGSWALPIQHEVKISIMSREPKSLLFSVVCKLPHSGPLTQQAANQVYNHYLGANRFGIEQPERREKQEKAHSRPIMEVRPRVGCQEEDEDKLDLKAIMDEFPDLRIIAEKRNHLHSDHAGRLML